MKQILIDALEPIAEENGLELVAIELVGSKKAPTIRVYLDGPDGISFDQVMSANSWIEAYFEKEDPFPGAYILEVSSPGIDRILRKRRDFERFIGETVAITSSGTQGNKKWTGTLLGMRDDMVVVGIDGHEEEIEFADIVKANVKGQIDFSGGRG
ncbi:MAG: ribosome maturation factor RimP [Actinobacteria bacterium]|nr:ribosome maturation factor RimP [Actinomycetota bacterium]